MGNSFDEKEAFRVPEKCLFICMYDADNQKLMLKRKRSMTSRQNGP